MKKNTYENWYISLITTTIMVVPAVTLAAGIENPLKGGGINTVTDLVVRTTQWLLGLAGALALLALVNGGADIITSFGSEEKMKKGKQTIMWALAGLVVVIVSFAMITAVRTLLGVAPP